MGKQAICTLNRTCIAKTVRCPRLIDLEAFFDLRSYQGQEAGQHKVHAWPGHAWKATAAPATAVVQGQGGWGQVKHGESDGLKNLKRGLKVA